jgi:hypothetical protein
LTIEKLYFVLCLLVPYYLWHTYFVLGDEDYIVLFLDGPEEVILFNTVPRLKNCLEVNNANCDFGMMADLNTMEHMKQATEAHLLVNKGRENEAHNEIFGERRRTYEIN